MITAFIVVAVIAIAFVALWKLAPENTLTQIWNAITTTWATLMASLASSTDLLETLRATQWGVLFDSRTAVVISLALGVGIALARKRSDLRRRA